MYVNAWERLVFITHVLVLVLLWFGSVNTVYVSACKLVGKTRAYARGCTCAACLYLHAYLHVHSDRVHENACFMNLHMYVCLYGCVMFVGVYMNLNVVVLLRFI
jgi:hypothetical protein